MGDGFGNDVVGGVGQLVRKFIQSLGYTPGVAGWRISRNGDAEFNNAIVRGEVDIGNPPITGLIIGTNIPNELVVFYNAASLADSCFLMYTDATHYYYEIAGIDHFAQTFHARGEVQAGIIYEAEYIQQGPAALQLQFLRNGPNTNTVIFGSAGVLSNAQFLHTLLSLGNNFSPNGDMTWHGTSLPRAVIAFERITGTIASAASATEQLMFTTANAYDFPTGRAFLVELVGAVAGPTVVNRVRFRIRKGTTIAGTTLLSWPTINIDQVSTDIPVYCANVFVNSSGASVNTKLTVSFNPSTANVVRWDGQASASGSPTYLRVTDIGSTNDYDGPSL